MKSLLIYLLVMIQLFLTGCWDYQEYERMAHVIALAVDYDDEKNQYTVTDQHLPATKSGNTSGDIKASPNQTGIVHSVTDKTIYGALSRLQQVEAKELFFGYLKVMIIGEKASKYKMQDIMELIDRTPTVRKTAYIAIVSGKAEDTIGTVDADSSISSGQEIFNLIELSKDTGAAYPITIHDFEAAMVISGLEAAAPHITTTSRKNKSLEARGGSKGNYRLDEQREGDQILRSTAVFKDNKLAGYLDEKEGLGYGWITGKKMRVYKSTEQSEATNTEDMFYYRIHKSKSKIKVKIEEGNPVIYIDVNVDADLRKYYTNKGSEYLNSREVKIMEQKLSDSIRSDINASLSKAQKQYESDIFGFGFAVFRKDPKLWQTEYEKKWSEVYPNLKVNINVKSKVINTGTSFRNMEFK